MSTPSTTPNPSTPPTLPQFTEVPNASLSACPSAVLFRQKLYVLHQQSGNAGWLWFTSSSNGQTWSADQQINNVGISASPSGVVFRDKLYAFHQGKNNSGGLWYTTYDGNVWSADRSVPNIGMSSSPSAVVFNDKLYVFHQGYNNSGGLWYTTSTDGVNWSADQQVNGVGMTDSPSAVVYGNQLYVFHQGWNKNGQLWYAKFNGSTWSGDQRINNAALSASPGAAVYFGVLYVFHQGSGDNGNLLYTAYNGTSWSADQLVQGGRLSWSPSAIDFLGNLEVFYQGPGRNGILCQCLYDAAQVVRVDYDLTKVTMGQITPVYSQPVYLTNNSSLEQKKSFTYSVSIQQTSRFENSVTTGVSLEVGKSFGSPVPKLMKTGPDIKVVLSQSQTWTYGQENSFTQTYADTTDVNVAPYTTMECLVIISKCNLSVPYTMLLRASNGTEVTSAGIWTGLSSCFDQTYYNETPLGAGAAQTA